MKPNLMKRSGVFVAAAMTVALISLGAVGGSALAQQTGGGSSQTGDVPLYKGLVMGSPRAVFDVSEEPGWLQGLSVSGFINSLTGMWLDSSAIRYQKSKNSLASSRSWLQLDINYILNGNNRF